MRDLHLSHLHLPGRDAVPRVHRQGGGRAVTAVIARAAIVPMFAEPSLRAEQTSQLVLGETATVLETASDWRQVRTRLDRYEGWVHAGYFAQVSDAEADAWWTDATAWSLGASVRVG